MARYQGIEDHLANLDIDDEENESFAFDEEIGAEVNRFELCLVGRFLTEKTINLKAMRSKMADVWKPTMGISIKELEQGIYLFQFYHKEDMQWVMKGGPWMFDNVMLALEPVADSEDPVKVPLWHVNIWIQIHDLPMGFMTEAVGKALGNFFGEFLEYDTKNNTSIWRECMRIRIRLDVRRPLKRKKKITKKDGKEFIVTCKYERLGEFCFSCGMVTHTDRFCRKFIDKRGSEGDKEWGLWLKAPPRRAANQNQSRWLREEGDDRWEARIGGETNSQDFRGENHSTVGKEIIRGSNSRKGGNTESRIINFDNTLAGYKTNSNLLYGLHEDETSGLKLDESNKRRREENSGSEIMDVDLGLVSTGPQVLKTNKEADISHSDLPASNSSVSAELAVQASRFQ